MNLENLNVVALERQELINTEGGGRIRTLIKILKKAKGHIEDFVEGVYEGLIS